MTKPMDGSRALLSLYRQIVSKPKRSQPTKLLRRGCQGIAMGLAAVALTACIANGGGNSFGSLLNSATSGLSNGTAFFPSAQATGSSQIAAHGSNANGPGTIQEYLLESAFLPGTVTDDQLLAELAVLYTRNEYQPLWHNGQEWLPAAVDSVRVLQNAKRHGLEPGDYLPSGQLLPHYGFSNAAAITQAEMALTSGILRYIIDVTEGRYAPTRRIDPVAEFLVGAQSANYGEWLGGLGGSNWIYRRMVNASGQHDQLLGLAWDRYKVTMERLRWDAPDLPTSQRYILLNVGSAEVWAMDGMNLDIGANAVVGRSTRRTPLTNDTITNLKFSPDWTAPYSIVEKDLVKFAKDDPGFVNLMGVEIFQGGKKIDPFSIDWNTINVRNYVFKQPPGPRNVLGGVRFTLQNSQAIYMHDSPDKGLFDDAFRAKSSGCIRVGASDEFALWMLKHQDPTWTIDRVRSRMNEQKSTFEQLDQNIPVRTIYTTAWVSHNGTLVTSPDVYGDNADLRRRMGLPVEEVGDEGITQVNDISDVF